MYFEWRYMYMCVGYNNKNHTCVHCCLAYGFRNFAYFMQFCENLLRGTNATSSKFTLQNSERFQNSQVILSAYTSILVRVIFEMEEDNRTYFWSFAEKTFVMQSMIHLTPKHNSIFVEGVKWNLVLPPK